MIHLDHNHSSSILANSPHAADQPSAVPWSSPSRDPRPFYPDSQEHASPDSSEQPALPDKPHESPSLSHTAAPSDAQQQQQQQQQHPPPETSPRSTTGARSPPPDSNSSLTPPPDAATEAPDDTQGQTSNTDGATMSGEAGTQATDEVDKASRQSTPLSELSSAPETAPDDENAAGDVQSKAESTSKDTDGGRADGGSSSTQQPSNMGSHSRQNSFAQGTSTSGQVVKQGSDGALSRQHSQASSLSPTHSKAPSLDPKVVSILELNSLLLRVSMDFQARGVPMTDQTFHQYSLRLQSNLTWLAAAADENHKVSQSLMALPIMTPPPVVEFAEMDRILHVYRELSSIFSKEIARRQQPPGPGGGLANGSMKRERTEEPGADSVHKRRDTGETKAQTPSGFSTPGAGPSTPHPPAQLMPQVPQMNMSGGPVQRMSSPSMPPPPVPPNAMGPNEAQMAAMRARQLQMRQAQQQQAQQQAQQQQHAESSRQMSPPANVPGMQHGGGPGPSPVPTLQQLNPAQLANLQSMGPMAVQHFQMLQNPNHPFMQYLVRQIPGFMSLPTQDKLQKMQVAHNMIQARQQAQAQGGNAMGGFPQGGGMPIAPQHSGDGSPSRMSPVQQQSPMQQSFPYGGGGGGGSSDPRTMFTPQQQAAIAQMNPQQRQLFLMQQQMMRGGGGGGGGGMNPQMSQQQQQMIQERMRLEQQRMQAAAAGQGVPNMGGMGGGMDGSQFPALRSNPGMPGIARSTRTPSESNPSPVSQQRMQSQDEQQQRMLMMQQAQAQAQAQQRAMSMGGGFPGGQQQGGGQGWNQNGGGQMQQQMGMGMGGQGQGAYGMVSPPGSAGGIGGGGGFPGMGGASSPAVSGNGGQMWGQGGGGGQFGGGPFMAPSPSASQHDGMTPGRGASATPGPHQHSPSADQAGLNEYDTFNWGQ